MSSDKKITILSHHFNRPEFIELQYTSLKKYLLNDFELVIFNDAKDVEDYTNFNNSNLKIEIDKMCYKYGIKCIRIPQDIHTKPYLFRLAIEDPNHPCCRCANVVQYSLNTYGFDKTGIVMILDSDMFLGSYFDVQKYMENVDIAGLVQSRTGDNNKIIEYIWNGIVFLNMDTLPNLQTINFNCGRIEDVGVDVGGYMYYYFLANSNIKRKHIRQIRFNEYTMDDICGLETESAINTDFRSKLIKLLQGDIDLNKEMLNFNSSNIELFENCFLHYRGGGNWDNKSFDYHVKKTKLFADLII